MRTLLGGLLTLVSMVAIVVALPSLWLAERVVDRDGFTATVQPLASDPEVKNYLADEVASAATDRSGIPQVGAVARKVAQAYANSPQFEKDFTDLVRQQHAWLFDEPAPGVDRTVMSLDITEMVNRVIAQTGISYRVPEPIRIPLDRGGGTGLEAGHYHGVGQQITTIGWWSAAVAVLAGLLALLVAHSRGAVLIWLGTGAVISALVSWTGGIGVAARAKQELSGADEAGRKVAEVVIDGALDDFQHTALVVGAVGAGVVIVGLVIRLISGHVSRR